MALSLNPRLPQIDACASKVFWWIKSPLDERFVDHNLGCDIREFAPLPRLHLFPHGFKVALHPIDAGRDAIDQRERFRVLGKHRRQRTSNNVSRFRSPEC